MKLLMKITSAAAAAALAVSVMSFPAVFSEEIILDSPEYTYPVLPEEYVLHADDDGIFPDADDIDSLSEELEANSSYHDLYYRKLTSMLTSAQIQAVDAKCDEILADVDPNWDTVRKCMFLNDYLCTHMAYDIVNRQKRNIYQALIEGSGVCEGYAKAFWYLADKLGINCRLVSSNALNHEWTIVEIDGNWYHIDVTWNDALTNNADVPGRALHKYFLIDDALIRSESYGHNASDWNFYEEGAGSALNKCSSSKYNTAFWQTIDIPVPFTSSYYFAVHNEKNYSVGKGVYRVDNNFDEVQIIMFTDTWPARSYGEGWIWGDSYSGGAVYNGRIFVNDRHNFYSCDENGDDILTEYTDTVYQSTHDICGFTNDNGVFTLRLADDAISPSDVKYVTVDMRTNEKPAASITEAPIGTSLDYTGYSQSLVTAGKASGGTMLYSLDGVDFSASIPTGKAVGTYKVYYKAAGDASHKDSPTYTIEVKIAVRALRSAVFKNDRIAVTYAIGDRTETEQIAPNKITPQIADVMSKSDCAAAVNAFTTASLSDTMILTQGQLEAIRRTLSK